MSLTTKVKFMGNHGNEVLEMKTLFYDYTKTSTFRDLFTYIDSEMNLKTRGYFPVSLGENLKEKILMATPGKISSTGEIDWDFNLEDCKIKESLEKLKIEPEKLELEIICTGPIGDGGGPSLTIDEIKTYIETFGMILETAIHLCNLTLAIKALKNFHEIEKTTNETRILNTIKTQERWKFGFCSKKNFEGKELVEESIMKYMEYEKDTEKEEWTNVDKNMG